MFLEDVRGRLVVGRLRVIEMSETPDRVVRVRIEVLPVRLGELVQVVLDVVRKRLSSQQPSCHASCSCATRTYVIVIHRQPWHSSLQRPVNRAHQFLLRTARWRVPPGGQRWVPENDPLVTRAVDLLASGLPNKPGRVRITVRVHRTYVAEDVHSDGLVEVGDDDAHVTILSSAANVVLLHDGDNYLEVG